LRQFWNTGVETASAGSLPVFLSAGIRRSAKPFSGCRPEGWRFFHRGLVILFRRDGLHHRLKAYCSTIELHLSKETTGVEPATHRGDRNTQRQGQRAKGGGKTPIRRLAEPHSMDTLPSERKFIQIVLEENIGT